MLDMVEDSPWNEAPKDFVIDPLVSVLKRTRRWGRDGRSLRALNRHWCAALNQHIAEVCPHWTRKIVKADVDSLLKFPNLTSLGTCAFEPKECSRLKTRCQNLSNVLSQLPYLSQLCVDRFFDFLEDEHVQNLKGITSLCGGEYSRSSLSKISCLGIEQLSGKFKADDIVPMISKMTTLKTLDIHDLWFSNDWCMRQVVAYLKQLETCSFHNELDDLGELLPQMTNLVSLDIYEARPEHFSDLPRLTSLTWELRNIDDLNTDAFKHLVKRLNALHFCFNDGSGNLGRLADNLLVQSTSLKSLDFSFCDMSQGLIDDLPRHHLTHLGMMWCKTPGPLSFIGRLTTLKDLHLSDEENTFPVLELDVKPLSKLINLNVHIDACLANPQLIKDIHSLSHLESLMLSDNVRCDDHFPFESFEALEDLPNLSTVNIHWPMTRVLFEKFIILKILTSLESLTISSYISRTNPGRPFVKLHEKLLRDKAPHLKLDIRA